MKIAFVHLVSFDSWSSLGMSLWLWHIMAMGMSLWTWGYELHIMAFSMSKASLRDNFRSLSETLRKNRLEKDW